MAKKVLVSVHDHKAESFSAPVASANNATAIRDFATVVNQPGGLMFCHPDDFSLVRLGEFDECSGAISVHHQELCKAIDVLQRNKE